MANPKGKGPTMKMLVLLFAISGLGGGNQTPAPLPVSLKCGIEPIPPIGCEVGPCVCDSRGKNCEWQFICD